VESKVVNSYSPPRVILYYIVWLGFFVLGILILNWWGFGNLPFKTRLGVYALWLVGSIGLFVKLLKEYLRFEELIDSWTPRSKD
jgi:hypothetical protein